MNMSQSVVSTGRGSKVPGEGFSGSRERKRSKITSSQWPSIVLWFVCAMAGITHAGTVTYVYTDPQGTPLAEADASGNITSKFDYAPYGSQALGTPPSGPGYTGHVNDPDTGLVYMQSRYYDPQVGRFLSVDPAGSSVGNVFNFNRFTYADNNPVINIDPDGRAAILDSENLIHGPGYSISMNPGSGGSSAAISHSSPNGGNVNVIDSAVGQAAARDANKALEGVAHESKNLDTLVRGWANAVQPIGDKYDVEIGSKLFLGSGAIYKFGPAMSDGVICSMSADCKVNIYNAANLPGILAGYTHTHPNNLGLSINDLYIAKSLRQVSGLLGDISVYASQPNGHIRKWSTEALRVPHDTKWTWRDYANNAQTLP